MLDTKPAQLFALTDMAAATTRTTSPFPAYKCCSHTDAFLGSLDATSTSTAPATVIGEFEAPPGDVEPANVLEAAYARFAARLLALKSNTGVEPNAGSQCSACSSPFAEDRGDLGRRLFMCVQCQHVACFNFAAAAAAADSFKCATSHANDHSVATSHFFAIDLSFGSFYCFICHDFQYEPRIEAHMRQHLDKAKLIRFGFFSEWEPSFEYMSLVEKFLGGGKNGRKNAASPSPLNKSNVLAASLMPLNGLRGLINLGNTCFMNCILQTFIHTPLLRDYFLSDSHICLLNNGPNSILSAKGHKNGALPLKANSDKKWCLVCELVNLFQEFYNGKKAPFMPLNLLYQIWTQVKHLAGYEQHDAHEFFIASLNAIHVNSIENDYECFKSSEEAKSKQNAAAAEASPTPKQQLNTCSCIIDKIFTGYLKSELVCKSCKSSSTKVDPFWDISLDLGASEACKAQSKTSESKAQGFDGLYECLNYYTLPETLTNYNCSHCKCTREATKQFTIDKSPVVCCFHLKRFEKAIKTHKKITKHVSFPETIDLSPFMSSRHSNSEALSEDDKSRSRKETKYFLFAVVNHEGTIESGHYSCYIRFAKESWFKCNDHIISKATKNDVMNSEGYLLFYHKMWIDYE